MFMTLEFNRYLDRWMWALIVLRLTYHALRGREEAGLRPNRAEIAPNRSAQVSNRSDSLEIGCNPILIGCDQI